MQSIHAEHAAHTPDGGRRWRRSTRAQLVLGRRMFMTLADTTDTPRFPCTDCTAAPVGAHRPGYVRLRWLRAWMDSPPALYMPTARTGRPCMRAPAQTSVQACMPVHASLGCIRRPPCLPRLQPTQRDPTKGPPSLCASPLPLLLLFYPLSLLPTSYPYPDFGPLPFHLRSSRWRDRWPLSSSSSSSSSFPLLRPTPSTAAATTTGACCTLRCARRTATSTAPSRRCARPAPTPTAAATSTGRSTYAELRGTKGGERAGMGESARARGGGKRARARARGEGESARAQRRRERERER